MDSSFFNLYLGALYNDNNICEKTNISASCDNSFDILMDKPYFTGN